MPYHTTHRPNSNSPPIINYQPTPISSNSQVHHSTANKIPFLCYHSCLHQQLQLPPKGHLQTQKEGKPTSPATQLQTLNNQPIPIHHQLPIGGCALYSITTRCLAPTYSPHILSLPEICRMSSICNMPKNKRTCTIWHSHQMFGTQKSPKCLGLQHKHQILCSKSLACQHVLASATNSKDPTNPT